MKYLILYWKMQNSWVIIQYNYICQMEMPSFSDDGENAVYIGEFGDIAIGPTKHLNSIQPIKEYQVYSDNSYKFSDVDVIYSVLMVDIQVKWPINILWF